MSFNIDYDNQPEKFLQKLDKHISISLSKIEDTLSINSVPHNAATIVGEHGVYRIRIGDYRVLYRVNYSYNKIVVIKIDKRSRVYD